ncbi:MAG: CapA family protein [Bacteroidales bacterium]
MGINFKYLLLVPFVLFFNILIAENEVPEDEKTDTVSVIGVGDIMMGTNFPSEKYLHPAGCNTFFRNIDSVLLSADITTGNLEGAISDSAELVKKCKDTTNCYAFRMPANFTSCLQNNGFDFLSIANNHSHDFGIEGVNHTVSMLDSMNIKYAGTPVFPVAIESINGVTVGFTAFAPNKGTLSLNNASLVKEIVKPLKDSCDIVIVSFHGGAEGADNENVTREKEYYYGEDRGNVYEFARLAIDAGADVVFGHGPHIPRAVDLYKNRIICYSLGNFITYGRFNLDGANGISPIVKVFLSEEGEFLHGEIIPVQQTYGGNITIDNTKRALRKIIALSKEDLPESELIIDESGTMLKKNDIEQ